eukprot:scaffold3700_cov387-Prasinococcus_capsulatus_cf.AAC.7
MASVALFRTWHERTVLRSCTSQHQASSLTRLEVKSLLAEDARSGKEKDSKLDELFCFSSAAVARCMSDASNLRIPAITVSIESVCCVSHSLSSTCFKYCLSSSPT